MKLFSFLRFIFWALSKIKRRAPVKNKTFLEEKVILAHLAPLFDAMDRSQEDIRSEGWTPEDPWCLHPVAGMQWYYYRLTLIIAVGHSTPGRPRLVPCI
jgi:hypothetical protein